MKLLMFKKGEAPPQLGILLNNKIWSINKSFSEKIDENFKNIESLLQTKDGLDHLKKITEEIKLEDLSESHEPSEIDFLPPVSNPKKIICVGLNYKHHILEMRREIPTIPVLFGKFSNTLIGHKEDIPFVDFSNTLDYEAELAVIIGKKAKNISKENAFEYIAGYSCFNDITIREYQRQTIQWMQGKNFDNHGPIGPYLVTKDEIPDLTPLKITSKLNGEIMQQSHIGDLIFDIPTLIEFITKIMTLEPGDIIATGTPSGVGFGRTPKVFMQPGDTIEISIDEIGKLTNRIK